MVEAEEAVPIQHYNRKNGAELDNHRKGSYEVGILYTKQIFGYQHVPR